ncbi:MAG: MBL fold metallo-hydrolase [Planctomycetes bacterium]|nr:MBL fold metallo-hydrolase [Planctomycetota bacterium]
MILEQHYLACLSQASYLIGDADAGVAAVVDPRRDVEVYREAAAKHGVEIRHVLLTHFHADFLSGHLELAAETGATLHLGAAASAEFDFEPLADGAELQLGTVTIQALSTPGHTPESTSYTVRAAADAAPRAVLTGDTLFIGDVGRPDLMSSVGVTAEDLAGELYDSVHQKLLALPDETIVYPGHGAGSSCGKNLSTALSCTIGEQRRTNYALQDMTREAFVSVVTAGQRPAPQYFGHDAALNKRERPLLKETLARALRPLTIEEALAAQAEGAVLLDARDGDAFAAGFLPGAVFVGLGGRFASWVGTVLSPDTELVLITDSGAEEEAVTRLGRIGYDKVRGFLEDASQALAGREDLQRVQRVDSATLAALLEGEGELAVIDVRAEGEFEAGRIAGAVNLPLQRPDELVVEAPVDGPHVLHCQGGYRSLIAASLIARSSQAPLVDLTGGFAEWELSGQAVER